MLANAWITKKQKKKKRFSTLFFNQKHPRNRNPHLFFLPTAPAASSLVYNNDRNPFLFFFFLMCKIKCPSLLFLFTESNMTLPFLSPELYFSFFLESESLGPPFFVFSLWKAAVFSGDDKILKQHVFSRSYSCQKPCFLRSFFSNQTHPFCLSFLFFHSQMRIAPSLPLPLLSS